MRKRIKNKGGEWIGVEYGDNKVGVKRNLVFIFRVSLVVRVCSGRTLCKNRNSCKSQP